MSEKKINQKLIDARDEVFRKVGRNIYNFQQVEKLLKWLNSHSQTSAPTSKIQEFQQKKATEINRLTMGPLVTALVRNVYSPFNDTEINQKELLETHFSFEFKIETDPEFLKVRKSALKAMVDERNDLVHHLFSRFDLNAVDSYAEIEKYLDSQRERVIVEYNQLIDLVKTLVDLAKVQADFVNSDEGQKLFELQFLQQSNLVNGLIDIAQKNARPDGWVLLGSAGREIRKLLPDEIEQITDRYGCKTLKDVLVNSELFDIYQELTAKGGQRLLYRVKAETFS